MIQDEEQETVIPPSSQEGSKKGDDQLLLVTQNAPYFTADTPDPGKPSFPQKPGHLLTHWWRLNADITMGKMEAFLHIESISEILGKKSDFSHAIKKTQEEVPELGLWTQRFVIHKSFRIFLSKVTDIGEVDQGFSVCFLCFVKNTDFYSLPPFNDFLNSSGMVYILPFNIPSTIKWMHSSMIYMLNHSSPQRDSFPSFKNTTGGPMNKE